VVSILGLCVSGCGTLPAGLPGPAVSTAEIVEAVRCEFIAAFDGGPDPARIADWQALVTITLNNDSGYETHPGFAGVAGKSGKLTWTAPSSGVGLVGSTTRKIETEYPVPVIGREINKAPCAVPHATGLDIASSWLRPAVAGAPSVASGAITKTGSYTNTFTVSASAGSGMTLKFEDFSLSLEGNKANASRVYKIDVRLSPPSKPTAPPVTFGLSDNLGLNLNGEYDQFSEMRRERDKDEEDDTVIKVPSGVPIVIGTP
jgi:hypothetical protein